MLAFSNRPLRWLAVLGVLASSFGLPLGGANPAQAADQLAQLKKIDRGLDSLIAAKSKKKKKHHKKHHHKKKASSSSTTPVAKKKHHKKKHHHKKKKKTSSVRQLEQKLDNLLDRDLGKKS